MGTGLDSLAPPSNSTFEYENGLSGPLANYITFNNLPMNPSTIIWRHFPTYFSLVKHKRLVSCMLSWLISPGYSVSSSCNNSCLFSFSSFLFSFFRNSTGHWQTIQKAASQAILEDGKKIKTCPRTRQRTGHAADLPNRTGNCLDTTNKQQLKCKYFYSTTEIRFRNHIWCFHITPKS